MSTVADLKVDIVGLIESQTPLIYPDITFRSWNGDKPIEFTHLNVTPYRTTREFEVRFSPRIRWGVFTGKFEVEREFSVMMRYDVELQLMDGWERLIEFLTHDSQAIAMALLRPLGQSFTAGVCALDPVGAKGPFREPETPESVQLLQMDFRVRFDQPDV